ncbi:MAG TPA: hypothetical protein VGK17_24690, partial [Propionicimonas sp.]
MLRSVALLSSIVLLTGFSCGGPTGVPCATDTTTRAQCPGSPATKRATAVQTLTAFQSSIRSEFSDAIWMGGIMG